MTERRKEIHNFIDEIPDNRLDALRPLLILLRGNLDIGDNLIYETDLTDEEKAINIEEMAYYAQNPDSAISLKKYFETQRKNKEL